MSAWDALALVMGLGAVLCSLLASRWLRGVSGDVNEALNGVADLESRVALLEQRARERCLPGGACRACAAPMRAEPSPPRNPAAGGRGRAALGGCPKGRKRSSFPTYREKVG